MPWSNGKKAASQATSHESPAQVTSADNGSTTSRDSSLTRIADRHYLIERGRVVWSGTSAELAAAPQVQHQYLGI